jgi:hypothetical protein
VCSTNQQAIFDQELTRRPIQAPSRMGAFIVECCDDPIFARKDQVEAAGARIHMHGRSSAFGDSLELA